MDLQQVIKHLQELKDVSLDIILPSLYHLQIYIFVNIQKGFCGIGRYNLCSSFKFLARDFDELVLPYKVYEPSGIVKIFRVRGITMFSDNLDMGDDDNSSLLQAQRILEVGNISHSTTLKAFLVKSTSGMSITFLRITDGCSFSTLSKFNSPQGEVFSYFDD